LTPPEDGFLEAETYVGFLNVLKKPNIVFFLNKVHLVGDETLITRNVISGFRRDIDDICALLGNYAASNGNALPTFRGQRVGPFSSWTS
jgi:hypothetical protein